MPVWRIICAVSPRNTRDVLVVGIDLPSISFCKNSERATL